MSSLTVARTEATGGGHSDRVPDRSAAHALYLISLAAKGILGLTQLGSGLLLMLAPSGWITDLVHSLAKIELVEDPGDPIALWVMHALPQSLLVPGGFYSIYLLIHGLLNLALVLALIARLGWAFPVSILVLFGFVAYQTVEFALGADPMMLVLSLIDLVVIALVLREWRQWRKAAAIPHAI